MKRGYFQRPKHIKDRDKAFAYQKYLEGFQYRDIEVMMRDLYKTEGPHVEGIASPCFMTIIRDIREVVKEYKELHKNDLMNDIDEIDEKLRFIYNESIQSHRLQNNPAYLSNARSTIETLIKLKGLLVEKKQLEVTGNIRYTKDEINNEIEKIKNIIDE